MEKIDIEFLSNLFEMNNIMEGKSIKKLIEIGGDQGLLTAFQSNVNNGVDSNENVLRLRQLYGENLPVERELSSIFSMIIECFGDTMLQILLIAALVSTGIGIYKEGIETGWSEGATIFFAVFLIVSITVGNNYVKERQFQKLYHKLDESKQQVIRNSKVQQIDSKELVVGDILFFNIGDLLQVDGLMVSGSEVKMDESTVTGESDSIRKLPYNEITEYLMMKSSQSQQMKNSNQLKKQLKNASPFMISGTKVMDGTGTMLVLTVGQNTCAGKTKLLLDQETPPTPLQQKLEGLAEDIGKFGTFVAIITFFALSIHQLILGFMGYNKILSVETLQFVIQSFMIGVTIIVVAVPEGLPLAVTIALAYSVNKMKDENNLVKNLASCETMGGANTICSDKTGTLTQNKMTVTGLWIENDIFMNQAIYDKKDAQIPKQMQELLAESVTFNSTAYPTKTDTGNFIQTGNKTECALLELTDKFGYSISLYRPTDKIVKVLPFSSRRKKMATVIYYKGFLRVFVKGASEIILNQSTKLIAKGQEHFLDENKKKQIKQDVIDRFASRSLRTIAIAYKDTNYKGTQHQLKELAFNLTEEELEKDLVLIAIAGIKDPIRKDVPNSIKACNKAGIQVRMLTGDNTLTAIAIAKESGILSSAQPKEYECMEGKDFRESIGGLVTSQVDGKKVLRIANQEIFNKISKQLKVLARATPEDKFMLVTGLIDQGNIVAVTGDGTNDAPALKKADVGFAMGESGSDVAKDAADIILVDDNFSSIITAIKWGRNIYDCIRKFIQFQLTVNIVALFMAFLGAVILNQSPLNTIQMLWVNLIMDTFASLALATEPPSAALLDRQPYKRTQPIVSAYMYRTICCQSLYQLAVLNCILFLYPSDELTKLSIFFQTFVIMQVFNSITCRQLDYQSLNPFNNLFNNGMFWLIQLLTVAIQFALLEFAASYVKVRQLTLIEHLICTGFGVFGILAGIIFKLIPEGCWRKVHLFKETEIAEENMDATLTSQLRRKSSQRLHSKVMINVKSGEHK
ncbi:unnamed protein product [Paramecium primaurelia]|uniref:Calcium-transporting ATPase n=1 Tax=Paramecium primaurelia TaxID=5886 RepID=A0A8S1N247_PARPR|nr:unnamed protein product [Paramecium primaurelia]